MRFCDAYDTNRMIAKDCQIALGLIADDPERYTRYRTMRRLTDGT
jgi:hypothetical protein